MQGTTDDITDAIYYDRGKYHVTDGFPKSGDGWAKFKSECVRNEMLDYNLGWDECCVHNLD